MSDGPYQRGYRHGQPAMTTAEYRQDDILGVGYCPRCHRSITIDTALCGYCTVHGKVPADFTRPTGWTDPDQKDPHRHIWDVKGRADIGEIRTCGICGERQRKEIHTWNTTRWVPVAGSTPPLSAFRHAETMPIVKETLEAHRVLP